MQAHHFRVDSRLIRTDGGPESSINETTVPLVLTLELKIRVDVFPCVYLDVGSLTQALAQNQGSEVVNIDLRDDDQFLGYHLEVSACSLKDLLFTRDRHESSATKVHDNSTTAFKLQIPVPTVSPVRWYKLRAPGVPEQVWHFFPKQDMAFTFFDGLPGRQRQDVKIFQLEQCHDGKRKFLVATMSKFSENYLSCGSERRHVYEIIREGFPCRLYFDLEFNIAANPHEQGDLLTALWVRLVLSKLHNVFGLCVGLEHVLVLDSTTTEKFSKHVVIQLWSHQHFSGCGMYGVPSDRELLFCNNSFVKEFVDSLILDLTEDVTLADLETEVQARATAAASAAAAAEGAGPFKYDEASFAPAAATASLLTMSSLGRRVPKPAYRSLWLREKGGTRLICLADLGVYSRNRMFRIFMSTKYGKKAPLTLTLADRRAYGGFGREGGSEDRLCQVMEGPQHRKNMQRSLLARSFVVPFDVLTCTGNEEGEDAAAAASAAAAAAGRYNFPGREEDKENLDDTSMKPDANTSTSHQHGEHLKRKRDFPMEASSTVRKPFTFSYPLLGPQHIDRGLYALPEAGLALALALGLGGSEALLRLQLSHAAGYGSDADAGIGSWTAGSSSAFRGAGSWNGARGSGSGVAGGARGAGGAGVVGARRSDDWQLRELARSSSIRQPSPFPQLDSHLRGSHASAGGVKGTLEKWSVYVASGPDTWQAAGSEGVDAGAAGPALHIKYTIGGNRYCRNVRKQHKSNAVMLDVNLARRCVVQTCWDPDCRGFRSEPMPLPAAVVVDPNVVATFQSDYLDRVALAILDEKETRG